MAKKQALREYLAEKGNSQVSLAEKVKLTPGAISQMVVNKRNITVIQLKGGVIELHENKVIASSEW